MALARHKHRLLNRLRSNSVGQCRHCHPAAQPSQSLGAVPSGTRSFPGGRRLLILLSLLSLCLSSFVFFYSFFVIVVFSILPPPRHSPSPSSLHPSDAWAK